MIIVINWLMFYDIWQIMRNPFQFRNLYYKVYAYILMFIFIAGMAFQLGAKILIFEPNQFFETSAEI
mgnify:CR=1 FL=1